MSPELKEKIMSRGRVVLSDSFIAQLSKTTRQGNSLKAPLQAINDNGIIPKHLLPQLEGWDETYNPARITPDLIKLGKEFLKRFTINYERVYEIHFPELLKEDLIDVAGYAWSVPVMGEYPRIEAEPNHCFVLYKPLFYAFDNYLDTDGDFIKKLAPNYDFISYGYRLWITEKDIKDKWWYNIFKFFNV